MSVGFAVVNEVIKKNIAENARVQGEYIKKRLFELKGELNIKNIRGEGLLLAFDFNEEIGKAVVDKCLEEGLILNSPRPAVIRLMPPLIVSKKEIDEMFDTLEKVVRGIKG
jgi:acetylornithine/N-succinyldiaminopimelate aminotransferase